MESVIYKIAVMKDDRIILYSGEYKDEKVAKRYRDIKAESSIAYQYKVVKETTKIEFL